MKAIYVTMCILVFVFVFSCQKKDEKQPIPQVPIQQAQSDSQKTKESTMTSPHGPIKRTEKKVEVPETVKKKWTKAVIVIEDKKTGKKTEQTVPIGAEVPLKDTKLTLRTGEFLPDFKMTETAITTASLELNNPALRVEILEGGETIFKGWLYLKFPDVHPFEHDKFSVKLKSVAP